MQKQTIKQIENRIYIVKKGSTTGRFSVGKMALGRKAKIELISCGSEDESSNMRLTMEEALKKTYKVIPMGPGACVQVPLIFLGSRVKIKTRRQNERKIQRTNP